MSLSPATRLGSYEIVAPLGAGGMGEVYRARDTKLGREVALKILPEAFASDPDRLMRFEREARTLASLNHPHIAQVYGIEDSPWTGSGQAGTRALVMELVPGEDLSVRIARGPIPLDEALPIARQIAEALEAAHEAGIIHRDLKPANIKLRDDGTVKVLDFGLAKALDVNPASATAGDVATITSPAMTMHGVILGTAAYMAPEQAKGKPVDRRADIWAFGCVLYEMLTGQRPFKGDDITETMTAVLRDEPDWAALPANVPAPVRHLLHACLEKDIRRRLRDAGDIPLLLGAPDTDRPDVAGSEPRSWRTPVSMAAGVALLTFAVGAVIGTRSVSAPEYRVAHLSLPLPPGSITRQFAITPDGFRVVYAGAAGTRLMVRRLDSPEPVEIARGVNLSAPRVSPNGQWVAYVEEGLRLMKVPIGGGPTTQLAVLDGRERGTAWLDDDALVVATSAARGLLRIPSVGGDASLLTTSDDGADHLWPERLPGGTGVVFTIAPRAGTVRDMGSTEKQRIAVFDVATGATTTLLQGGGPARVVNGAYLAYLAQGTIFAVPFDLSARIVRAGSAPVATGIRATAFDVASDGTLIYAGSDPTFGEAPRSLVWVDRAGKEVDVAAEARPYQYPQISPDGSRVAIAALGESADIWMLDARTGSISRLTFDPAVDTSPVWTPDGRRLVFASDRGGGVFNLWWQAADGTGEPERLTTSTGPQFPTSITPDGRHVIFWDNGAGTARNLWMVALDDTRQVTPLLQSPDDELMAAVSPDGQWMAFESSSSGRKNIFVRPFPQVSLGLWQVSGDGGSKPVWSRDGTELFFIGGTGALSRVRVATDPSAFRIGAIEPLLPARYYGVEAGALVARTYDPAPDGKRFIMLKAPALATSAASPGLSLVQHWASSLGSGATIGK